VGTKIFPPWYSASLPNEAELERVKATRKRKKWQRRKEKRKMVAREGDNPRNDPEL
jgi:hypothetical protein